MGASCYFIGHREADKEILPALAEEVERHIVTFGVTDFFVGHYGRFDLYASDVIAEAKLRHPEVRLMLVLPFHPAIHPIKTPKGFDGTYYPWEDEKVPKRLAIIKTNQRMVDTSDYLISYAHHHLGGTGQIVEYARRRETKGLIRVTNLSKETPLELIYLSAQADYCYTDPVTAILMDVVPSAWTHCTEQGIWVAENKIPPYLLEAWRG